MTPADLKAWRAREGLSQRAAATFAGVHRVTWANWERGKFPVPHWLGPKLREACGSAP